MEVTKERRALLISANSATSVADRQVLPQACRSGDLVELILDPVHIEGDAPAGAGERTSPKELLVLISVVGSGIRGAQIDLNGNMGRGRHTAPVYSRGGDFPF
jgi:hypothetical protein